MLPLVTVGCVLTTSVERAQSPPKSKMTSDAVTKETVLRMVFMNPESSAVWKSGGNVGG